MGVTVGIAAAINVTVTGTENLSGIVNNLSIDPAEVDQPPVRLRFQFKNDGNVEARPVAHWQIKDASGTTVGDVTYQDTVIQPGQVDNVVSEWDQTGKAEGKYTVSASVTLGDKTLAQKELDLEILPRGTLTRSGALETITVEGNPAPGTLAKVDGAFRNTGQIDTHAVFTVDLYQGDQLIQTAQSSDRLVTVGELAFLEAVVTVKDPGNYRVTGSVNYEGKVTDLKEVTFMVAPPPPPTDQGSSSQVVPVTSPASSQSALLSARSRVDRWLGSWIPLTVVLMLGVGVLVFTFVSRRRARRSGGTSTAKVKTRVAAASATVSSDEQFSRGVLLHRANPAPPPKQTQANEARKAVLRPISTGSRKRE